MTSKEIVRRTLEFDGPERLARSLPEPWGSDLGHVPVDYTGLDGGWKRLDDDHWEHLDEWGNLWRGIGGNKGEVVRGALQHIDDAGTVPLPPLDDPARYAESREALAKDTEHFMVAALPGFTFNIARKMRRLDQYMMDLHLHREQIETLHNRIDDLLVGMVDHFGEAGADAISTLEDWGTQLGLMIHPDLWRELFKPRFRRICDTAHRHNMKVLMHSCGRITDIIPDLIEVGVDALLFDQQKVHGLDNLAQYAGQVTYMCPVDIQSVLQTGDEATIRAWARELIDRFWCGGRGGFIADAYGGEGAIGVEPEWQRWASDEFVKAGVRT